MSGIKTQTHSNIGSTKEVSSVLIRICLSFLSIVNANNLFEPQTPGSLVAVSK